MAVCPPGARDRLSSFVSLQFCAKSDKFFNIPFGGENRWRFWVSPLGAGSVDRSERVWKWQLDTGEPERTTVLECV